jgi:hypothetical protein
MKIDVKMPADNKRFAVSQGVCSRTAQQDTEAKREKHEK